MARIYAKTVISGDVQTAREKDGGQRYRQYKNHDVGVAAQETITKNGERGSANKATRMCQQGDKDEFKASRKGRAELVTLGLSLDTEMSSLFLDTDTDADCGRTLATRAATGVALAGERTAV